MYGLNMTDYLSENERIVYRIEKDDGPARFQMGWTLAALLVVFIFSIRLVKVLILRQPDMELNRFDLLWRGFAMAFLWWSSVAYLIQYRYADLIKTDKHIILRRGLSRNVYIIPHSEVAEVETVDYMAKWGPVLLFKIHLKDGSCVRSGNFYPIYSSFKLMERHLTGKIHDGSRKKAASEPQMQEQLVWEKGGAALTALILVPVLIFTLLGLAGAVDINSKLGVQDVVLKGTVTETLSDSQSGTTVYSLKYFNDWDAKRTEYEMNVNKDTYDNYTRGDKVRIEAKRGCLGLLYDIKLKFEKK